jgi:ureidoglycolate dehydrogenase (NAD+)
LRFTKIAPALGLLDGGHGLGQIVMSRAANEAMGLARDAGAGWVAVRNSSHCGALAFYCKKIADEGMIGVAFTHADSMVIPFAAGKPFCGTNPICVTAPSEDGNHLCLDMATSIAPGNSVMNAALEGLPIPGDWGIDDKGRSTTDPKAVIGLHPFGSYKGSGLGLVIDVLCSLLSGAPYGPDIPPMYGELDKNRRLGGLIGVIDPSRFEDISQFRRRVHEMLRRWQALPAVDPTNPVLFPGQPELITRQERLKTGIPLGPALMKQLASVAGDLPLPWAENHRDTD